MEFLEPNPDDDDGNKEGRGLLLHHARTQGHTYIRSTATSTKDITPVVSRVSQWTRDDRDAQVRGWGCHRAKRQKGKREPQTAGIREKL